MRTGEVRRSMNIHDVYLTAHELELIGRGGTVQTETDQRLAVTLYRAEDGEPSARQGEIPIPIGDFAVSELRETGHSGWAPNNSPYVFGLHLRG
jgi:hypothetical protein